MKKIFIAVLCTVGMLALSNAASAAVPPTVTQQGGVATAQSTPPDGAGAVTARMKMVVRGFDSKVASAHGYQIAYDQSGKSYVYKPGQPKPSSSGGNYKYGNCGDSFIYFNGVGNKQGFVYTGFDIPLPAVEVHWPVTVVDSTGVGTVPTDCGAAVANWRTDFYTNNSTGQAYAEVAPGAFVIMTNGAICYSLGPVDHTVIY